VSAAAQGPDSHIRPAAPRWVAPAGVGFATLVALALSVVIGAVPVIAAVVIVIAGIQLVRSPDNAVWIVGAILYSNAAVIGARFHGIPFAIAAAFPLLLCLPIARDLLLRGLQPVISPALPFVLAFLVVQIVGALFSVAPERSLEGAKDLMLEGLLLFVLFTNAIRTPEVLRRLIWAVTSTAAGLGALVAYQQLTGSYSTDFGGFAQLDADGLGFYTDSFRGEGANRQKRIGGPIGEPNRWAQIMLVLVPIALFQARACSRRLHKIVASGVCILILVGGSLGFSRGGAVGLGLTVLLMTLMGYVRGRHIAAAAAGLLVVALLVPQYAVRLSSLGNVLNLASSTTGPGLDNADSGTRGRITEMVAAGLVFADHPIVGVGPRMFREHYVEYARIAGGRARGVPRQAHNLGLDIAAENGVLGLIAFGGVIFVTLRELLVARRRLRGRQPELENLVMGVFFAMVTYLATSVFLHASYIRYAWFLIAVAAATSQVAAHSPVEPRLMRMRIR
jgi:O-antigen ligase